MYLGALMQLKVFEAGQGLDITSLWMLSGERNERVISWLEARQSSSTSSQSQLTGPSHRRSADGVRHVPLWEAGGKHQDGRAVHVAEGHVQVHLEEIDGGLRMQTSVV